VLQLGTGALNANCTKEIHDLGVQLLAEGSKEICDNYAVGNCLPRDWEEFHDAVEVGFQFR
jgi:hypothetical protein